MKTENANHLHRLDRSHLMRRMTPLIAAVLVFSGCGSGGGDEESAATTTPAPTTTVETTTTTEAPTTTAVPVDYGQQYIDLVTPSNCAVERFEEAMANLSDTAGFAEWEAAGLPALADELTHSWVEFYEGLVAAEWPDDAQGAIDDLVAEVSAYAQWSGQIAAATTSEGLAQVFERAPGAESNAAGVVRAKLGLPSNVTDETSCV